MHSVCMSVCQVPHITTRMCTTRGACFAQFETEEAALPNRHLRHHWYAQYVYVHPGEGGGADKNA